MSSSSSSSPSSKAFDPDSIPSEIWSHILSFLIHPSNHLSLPYLLVSHQFFRLGQRFFMQKIQLDSLDDLLNLLLCKDSIGGVIMPEGGKKRVFEFVPGGRFEGGWDQWEKEVGERLKWVQHLRFSESFDTSLFRRYAFHLVLHPHFLSSILSPALWPSLTAITISGLGPAFYEILSNDIPVSTLTYLTTLLTTHNNKVELNIMPSSLLNSTTSSSTNAFIHSASHLSFAYLHDFIRLFFGGSALSTPSLPRASLPNTTVRRLTVGTFIWDFEEPHDLSYQRQALEVVLNPYMHQTLREVKVGKLVLGLGDPVVRFDAWGKERYLALFRDLMAYESKFGDVVKWDDEDAIKASKAYELELAMVGGSSFMSDR